MTKMLFYSVNLISLLKTLCLFFTLMPDIFSRLISCRFISLFF